MSGKTDRRIRKAMNKLALSNKEIALQQMKQLFDSPFKTRFKFCMKLLFRR